MTTLYDEKGNIGRRYRRQDEAGTPFCITIDSETLSDETVTIRDRDTCEQIRIPMVDVLDHITERLKG
jgi:glycyl-tRNA synthetase